MRKPNLHSFHWRLIFSLLILVSIIILLLGVSINRIFNNYLIQDEVIQFNHSVQAVFNELHYFNSLDNLKASLAQLERLTGVNLELVSEPKEIESLLNKTNPNDILGHKQVDFFNLSTVDDLIKYIPFFQGGDIVAILKIQPNSNLSPARTDLNNALLRIGLLSMLGSLALAFAISRSLSKPLIKLTMAAKEFGLGNLSHRAPEDRPDELGILGRQFNLMSDQLNSSFNLLTEERDRLKEFIADVSHELRTPLTALNTFNELLMEGAIAEEAVRKEFLENSRIQIQRLNKLSENLLQLSKLDSGLIKMNLSPGNILAAIEESLDGLQVMADTKNIRINRYVKETNILVQYDSFFFDQVITNIVGNAIKYTPEEGEVNIQISHETEFDKNWLLIKVWDTGGGIPLDDVDKLFKRFYRGKNRSKDEPGTGLGLAIARSIIEAHNGTVEITQPQKAEFTIKLPIYIK